MYKENVVPVTKGEDLRASVADASRDNNVSSLVQIEET